MGRVDPEQQGRRKLQNRDLQAEESHFRYSKKRRSGALLEPPHLRFRRLQGQQPPVQLIIAAIYVAGGRPCLFLCWDGPIADRNEQQSTKFVTRQRRSLPHLEHQYLRFRRLGSQEPPVLLILATIYVAGGRPCLFLCWNRPIAGRNE